MQRQGPATLEGATNRPNHCSVGKPPFTQWIALILFQSKKNDKWRRKKEVFLEEALHLGLIKIQKNGSRLSKR